MRKTVIGSGMGLVAAAALPAQAAIAPVTEPAGVTAAGSLSFGESVLGQRQGLDASAAQIKTGVPTTQQKEIKVQDRGIKVQDSAIKVQDRQIKVQQKEIKVQGTDGSKFSGIPKGF